MTNDPTLLHILDKLRQKLEKNGRTIGTQPVQYGIKITLYDRGDEASGSLYHSAKKKKISWVPNGKNVQYLADDLAEALEGYLTQSIKSTTPSKKKKRPEVSAEENSFKCWVGTDETGKGDLFGPLVVGGFVADRDMVEPLALMGVKDSKEMSSAGIKRVAKMIREAYPDRYSIVAIYPERYNEMYPDFETQGGINGLLGWGHARAIRDMMEKFPGIEAAVVDKFGGEHRLKRHLPKAESPAKIVMRPKAESNLAVAAAAILAREKFEYALMNMKDKLGFIPHAGSGAEAQKDLNLMAKDHKDDMNQFVKMHFAPVKALRFF